MEKYLDIAQNAFSGYWNYLTHEIFHPHWQNYFYWLLGLSLAVWLLEILFPWRKNQPRLRKDFWLDGFYMFFNFFLFSLIIYNALSHVAVEAFNDFIGLFGAENIVAINIAQLPGWLQFLILFILADFIQWNVHRLLHRVSWLWQFHKVHHSVEQLGFAAHLRFHWMETIIYKTIQFIPLTMIGFGIDDLFILHILTLSIGHLNHANLNLSYGPLKYIFNNPAMHIWHHAEKLPSRHGVNFGISLSIWDYLFRTAYIPQNGRDIKLGFDDLEEFPKNFGEQVAYPFYKKKV